MQKVVVLKPKPAGGGPNGIEPPTGPLGSAAGKFLAADQQAIEAEGKLRAALAEIDGAHKAVRRIEEQRAQTVRGMSPRETAEIELALADAIAELGVVRGRLADAQSAEQIAGDLADELGHQFATVLDAVAGPIRDRLRDEVEIAATNLRLAVARVGSFAQTIGSRERIPVDKLLELPGREVADELASWTTIAAATSALLRRQR